ncbi:UNVERIFIED_CONTAM: hypothetical protein GTU68_064076 [Idotea baltica]|nr:hypothetical protein [Idotea baltica]
MTLKTKHSNKYTKMSDDDTQQNEEIANFKKLKSNQHSQKKRKHSDTNQDFDYKKKTNSDSGEKPDWKKVKQERKELKVKRKQSDSGNNELYDVGVQAKKIWEELRRDDCKVSRKAELMKELYALIKGKIKSLVYAHDTVRVIETLVSLGGDEFRSLLFSELKDDFLALSKNKYSVFFVIKLLRYGTREQKNSIISSMSGHVVTLMRHKIACDVLELAYNDYANAKQRAHMMQEFYGPRFKLFKEEDITTLDSAIAKHPELKESILKDVSEALQPILDKGVFTNTMIHTLLKEYLYACDQSNRKGIIETIRESLLPILHTRDGARVAMMCLWYGSSKDRKMILKSFKGKYVQIALEEHGHMVILAAIDCVDDTVLLSKVALSELNEGLLDLVKSDSGRKVLKYLVAPRNKLFFHPKVLAVLEEGDDNPHSKKSRADKYTAMREAVSKPVLKLILDNIKTWARDSQWTLFVASALEALSGEGVTPIFDAIAEICAEPFLPGDDHHFLEVAYMAKMVSFLVACDKKRFQEGKPIFSSSLLEMAETEMRGWVLRNRGCFILVKLFETEIPSVVEQVTEICLPLKKKLPKMDYPGAQILLKKLENKK